MVDTRIVGLAKGLPRAFSSAVGVLGDSIVSNGYGNNMFQLSGGRSFMQWASMYSGGAFFVSNAAGIAGYRTDQIEDVILPRFLSGIAGGVNPAWGQSAFIKPAHVYMEMATNDISQLGQVDGRGVTITHASIIANVLSIANKLLAIGCTPILHCVIPRGDNLSNVLLHNGAVKALGAKMGVPVFDAFEVMADPDTPGFMKAGYNAILSGGAADNVHPGSVGANAWGKALASFMMRLVASRIGAVCVPDSGSSWANGLMQTDATADGLPDGWSNNIGANGSLAIVTDASVVGKALQITLTADAGGNVRTPIKNNCNPGDWLLFQARVKWAKSGSTFGPSFNATLRQYPTASSYFFAGFQPTTSFANASTGDGIFPTANEWMDLVSIVQMPPNAGGTTAVWAEFGLTGSGSVLSIAQTGVTNLTTGGVVLP